MPEFHDWFQMPKSAPRIAKPKKVIDYAALDPDDFDDHHVQGECDPIPIHCHLTPR